MNVVPYSLILQFYTINLMYNYIGSPVIDCSYIVGIDNTNMIQTIYDKADLAKTNLLITTSLGTLNNNMSIINLNNGFIYPTFSFPNKSSNIIYDNIFDTSSQTTFNKYGLLLNNVNDTIKSRIDPRDTPSDTTNGKYVYILRCPPNSNNLISLYSITEYFVDYNTSVTTITGESSDTRMMGINFTPNN